MGSIPALAIMGSAIMGGAEEATLNLVRETTAHGFRWDVASALEWAVDRRMVARFAELGVRVRWGRPAVEEALRRPAAVAVSWGVRLSDHADPGRLPPWIHVAHLPPEAGFEAEVLGDAGPAPARVVAVSRAAWEAVPEPLRPITTLVPNMIDPARVAAPPGATESVRRELECPEGTRLVGYVGRLSPEKRVDLILFALSQLPPDWRLVIVGGGPDRDALERLAVELGLRERARFVGGRAVVGPYLAAMDHFAHASMFESFGLSMAEAMLAGVPVVAPAVGLVAERPHLARVVERSAEGLAAGLLADAADPEGTRRRATAARAEIARDFGREAFTESWVGLLRGVARPLNERS